MMDFALDAVTKPLLKLRKLIKSFPNDPSPEDVHALRTQARRLEAILETVTFNSDKQPKRLRDAMTPVRKAAGGVRDMDVLIGDVLTLSSKDRSGAAVRLVEHLSEKRERDARHLYNMVSKRGKKARVLLKQFTRLIEKQSNGDRHTITESAAAPQIVAAQLDCWPKLDSENLHEFRIYVKKLRYILQLSQSSNGRGMKALAEAKDSIGDWHDWTELLKIAKKVLDPKADRAMLSQVQKAGDERYRVALTTANQLRKQDLDGLVSNAAQSKRLQPAKRTSSRKSGS